MTKVSDTIAKKAAIFAPKLTLPKTTKPRGLRLSVVIGGLAAFASAFLMLWVVFFQSDNNIAIELTSVSATPEGRLELQGLSYMGKTKSGDPYTLNAEKASEDASNANIVHLSVLDGQVSDDKNGQITLKSNKGQFDQVKNFVMLEGNVIITQSARALTFKTNILDGDLNKGDFDAPQAVDLTSPTSHITAEAMRVTAFGDKIVFIGKSHAIIGEDKKS